ncbi:sugar transporter, putative [Plasmodium berghei]|uniref:Major facilitator superfamily domain-containing protein, putative n=2 Tax=Plasmodium berghei TaxID=5821 RepID=A0A509AIJ2_PLABA|nr:major facilitator superfamily domain-containing protein, putative [Plasmodium berghei ANKA]CXI33394.1 sugar transporter, putative [Plasmodium berghei]SCM21255.1 sugar transporter, putative [Plasmodium berghei]SCN24551.1 sugar transporter, putative [Plasmodium berghei]SCO59725.1 sugar transporter, putative [Plasmodium berghei]SCO60946.1 sugar transporter, putative [Plasmodium berghei]|eukprot:XP_034421176.1 major facilitator superfamily domain-containing protein, putative [Plasmodium berghei ANKA]
MMYLTKIVSNACLAIINFGLCLSLTSLSRKMLIKGYNICPEGYRGCDKEKWYFSTFYFTLYMSGFLGCFISLFFRNVNRKKFMQAIHYLYIIGSLFTIYYEPHVILFLFSQAFFGLAIGCSIVIVCFYIFEYSPKEHQNYYGFTIQTFFSIGLLISYLFGVIYEHVDFNKSTSYWILMILQKLHMLMPLIFSVISILLLKFVFTMDTPLHLYKSQKYDKFEEIKKKISKNGIDEKHEYHSNEKNNEINIILNDLTFIDLFKDTKLRKKCIIGSILCYLFCFSGCTIFFNNLFLFYEVFKTKKESAAVSMIFMFIYFVFTIITTKLAHYYNNKNKLIILGFILQLISSFIMMICSFCNLTQVINKLIISINIILYIAGFSLGFGHIIWTHIFHIFSKEYKVVGAFCSYYAIFIGAFIMSTFLEFTNTNRYSYLFIIFIIFSIISIIFFKSIYLKNSENKKKEDQITESHDPINISDTMDTPNIKEAEI